MVPFHMTNVVKLDAFLAQLSTPLVGDRLFAQLPDVVYCIKDLEGRYITANKAFADRLNLRTISSIIGKTAHELFPADLAESYTQQDEEIYASGEDMIDRLEVFTDKGRLGWHLASKFVLHGKNDTIVGIAAITRDLLTPCAEDLRFAGIARVVTRIQKEYPASISLKDLASDIDLTVTQLDRRMKKVFKFSTAQFIRKTRIEAATTALKKTKKPIAQVAQECGYSDQSAFTRQFSATVGMTPGAYRANG